MADRKWWEEMKEKNKRNDKCNNIDMCLERKKNRLLDEDIYVGDKVYTDSKWNDYEGCWVE